VASHHEHYDHPWYSSSNSRFYDTIEIAEGSVSPVHQTRHAKRKSEGAISLEHLQKSLTGAGVANVNASSNRSKNTQVGDGRMVGVPSGPFGGKKLAVSSPVTPPRRSLLSDLLSSQGSHSRLEQNANRRRMLKSMRRYSVDASEMDFSVSRPSSRFKHLEGIPAEEEGTSTLLADGGRQGFSSTPTVRYLRNPCHAAVKTKLLPSAYRGTHVRRAGAAADEETPDYFGAEDRVW